MAMIDPKLASAAETFTLQCVINKRPVSVDVPPAKRLLCILREDLHLTGTKRSCDIGRCGACMVLVDGKPVNSCLTMAYQCQGKNITTIEGLAADGALNRVQKCFLEEGGYQCGYCTPGMIVTVTALLNKNPEPSMAEIEEALSGNLCRCTGYGGIIRSVLKAAEQGGATACGTA